MYNVLNVINDYYIIKLQMMQNIINVHNVRNKYLIDIA